MRRLDRDVVALMADHRNGDNNPAQERINWDVLSRLPSDRHRHLDKATAETYREACGG